MKSFKKESAYELWKKALIYIRDNGRDFEDEDGRICKEVFNLALKIKSCPGDIEEPIKRLNDFEKWIYPSLDEIENNILSKDSSIGYEYSYGNRILAYSGNGSEMDQLNDFVLPLLEENQSSRRAVVTLWNPLLDSDLFKKEVPGILSIDFKLRSGKLNVTEIIRSNDIFYGWPANIYQLYSLQKFVADELGAEPGFLTTVSTSAHIFEDQEKYIGKVLQK